MTVPVMGYFAIRGLGQVVRYTLACVDIPYKDHQYKIGPRHDYKSEWRKDMHKMGFLVPNLPYFIDGDLKITDTRAIMCHLSRRAPHLHLDGRTEAQKVKVDMLYSYIIDIGRANSNFVHTPHTDEQFEKYTRKAENVLKTCEGFIGGNNFFCGDEVTYVDFIMYETLVRLEVTIPGIFSNYPEIVRFSENFEQVPAIKKYMASPEFQAIKHIHNAPYACCGTGREQAAN